MGDGAAGPDENPAAIDQPDAKVGQVCATDDGPGTTAGSDHGAGDVTAPGLPRRNPVPALLTSLLAEGLDPGYAQAAQRRAERAAQGATETTTTGTVSPPRRARRTAVVAGVLAVGLVFGIAARATQQNAPSAEAARDSLLDDVHAAQRREQQLEASISTLGEQIRSAQAALGATGPLQSLSALGQAGALTAVHGPGLQIVIDGADGQPGTGVILDSDIQLLVNGLWQAGAEAVAVGGVRLRTTSAIRQAGGAILVDNQPVFWPITIQAIGDPSAIHVAFVQTDGFARFSAFASLYKIRFDLTAPSDVTLPPAPPPDIRFASVPTAPSMSNTAGSGPATTG